jgi:A/G-specific adenine glycosylase
LTGAARADGPQRFAPRLIAWQRAHGRHDLPWQASRDPYRVWLSEIMLQQTQVSVVALYYPRFLERFPTLQALAAADLDAVLAQWSGLGYYRRARHLHECARQVCNEHGGCFPRQRAELEALSGIGRSTAAAIAAFCFGAREAILDGNVKRVLRRAFDRPQRGESAAALRELWELAETLLPRQGIEAYTQGLMDLGATVCKPRNPECGACPFDADCLARPGPAPREAPNPEPVGEAGARRGLRWTLLWAEACDASGRPRIWLQRRDAQGIWPSLWCLPQHEDAAQALRQAAELGEITAQQALRPRRHVLTHLDLHLQPLRVRLTAPRVEVRDAPDGAWFSLEEAFELGLPAALRQLLLDESAA